MQTVNATPLKEYRAKARKALEGNWGICALIFLVFYVVVFGLLGVSFQLDKSYDNMQSGLYTNLNSIVLSLVLLPLGYGFALLFLSQLRGQKGSFAYFKEGWNWRVWTTIFLKNLYVFLWLMLGAIVGAIPLVIWLIVTKGQTTSPVFWLLVTVVYVAMIAVGLYKQYAYAQTEFLLVDHEELTRDEAIERSMAMMRGHKMKLFLLDLSFIGWWLLCLLTLCIGFLWLAPYYMQAHAVFYEKLAAEPSAGVNVPLEA